MTKRSSSDEMNDLQLFGPMEIRGPKIRCDSKLIRIKFNYVWTISDYKSAFVTVEESKESTIISTLISEPFKATRSEWHFAIQHCQINSQSSESDTKLNVSLRRETSYREDLDNLKAVEVKCAIINAENQESSYCIQKKHLLDPEEPSEEYFVGDIITNGELLKNENELLPQNKLTLDFEIIFYRQENVIGDYQESNGTPPELIDPKLEYFGKLFNNSEFSDVTIHVNGKEIPAHKIILAGCSPVFANLLKHDPNRIDVEGIKEEIFLEALRFIYTGKVQDLETRAFDLLPVADKYDLGKLKIFCGNVLSEKLSADTAVKILKLADTYHVETLKAKALKYIAAFWLDVVGSDGWNDLSSHLSAQPLLIKDVLLACLK